MLSVVFKKAPPGFDWAPSQIQAELSGHNLLLPGRGMRLAPKWAIDMLQCIWEHRPNGVWQLLNFAKDSMNFRDTALDAIDNGTLHLLAMCAQDAWSSQRPLERKRKVIEVTLSNYKLHCKGRRNRLRIISA